MKELLFILGMPFLNEKERFTLSKLIREVSDWDKLINLINNHGIVTLAAYNIKEAGLDTQIPQSVRNILENGLRQNIVRNIWLKERWKEVNQNLCSAGIKHILLKGMALEFSVYGGKGLRQMSDNDILIHRDDAIKAWKLLQNHGFKSRSLKSSLHYKMLAEIGKHLPTLVKDGYVIEIHTRLSDSELPGEVNYNKIFNDATQISIDDQKAFILAHDINIKYLNGHFKWHQMTGDCQLRSFADLILVDKDSEYVFPDQFILDPIQSNKRVFRKAAYKSAVRSVPAKYRLRYILGDIFPSLDWMRERYGCRGMKVFLYYPGRVMKLFWLL